jgi:hypothetical protein
MRTCDVCGEPIPASATRCPYCESPQAPDPAAPPPGPPLRTLDVEAGLPTVDEALRRLESQLERAREDRVRLLRVIHGWGSSTGGGGKIRAAVRRRLLARLDAGQVRCVLFGDHYAHDEPQGRDLLRRHPILHSSERTDRRNPGITFVEP